MTTTIALILLGVAVAIIAGLAAYAFTLWREVCRRRDFQRQELKRAHDNCLENLAMVASALQQEQVDITEGAWRCKVLLDILDQRLVERPAFQAFADVYARTRHLHTHSARESLTPRERFQEDRERLAVEHEMRPAILAAAGAVMEFHRGWPDSLH